MNVKDALKYVHVDVKGLAVDWVLESVVKPELEKIVADSSNQYDDMLLSYVYPLVKAAVEKAAIALDEKV